MNKAETWQMSLQFRRQTWGFRFSSTARSQRVSTIDCNIERQASDRDTNTRNSYTTRIATDSVEIPTASPGFLTMATPKAFPADGDNDRQPEMAMWLPKPEIRFRPPFPIVVHYWNRLGTLLARIQWFSVRILMIYVRKLENPHFRLCHCC